REPGEQEQRERGGDRQRRAPPGYLHGRLTHRRSVQDRMDAAEKAREGDHEQDQRDARDGPESLREAGAEDHHFADEKSERRQADEREHRRMNAVPICGIRTISPPTAVISAEPYAARMRPERRRPTGLARAGLA